MNPFIRPQQQARIVLLATMMLSLQGCGGGGDSGASSPPTGSATRTLALSDLQIAQSIYSGAPRTPPGFYSEIATGHSYVSTEHVKNSDIDGLPEEPPREYELCTNDWNEALAWSETSAQQASPYADLVETSDDARFFGFGRSRPGEPSFYLRARVFKCAYLDRSAANLRNTSGPAGEFNLRPLTAAELQTLSEYLWQFTTYNNFGNVVLKSSGATTSVGLAHTLHIASLARGAISSACDRVDVIAWRHEVDLATGELELDMEALWSFGARESAGSTELCTN